MKKQKRENYIDKELYDEIMIAMKRSGIPQKVFDIAKQMDMNLPEMFKKRIIDLPKDLNEPMTEEKIKENSEYFSKNLLGIYGNYFAYYYYDNLLKKKYGENYKEKYELKNEMPYHDENRNVLGRSDLFLRDEKGNETYCEVKAAPFILYDINNFSALNNSNKDYTNSQKEIKKYQHIGQKLLQQVTRLKKTGGKVLVILFDGCKVDNVISEKLEKMEVEVKYLQLNINVLESYVDDIIDKIKQNFFSGKNNINSRKIS